MPPVPSIVCLATLLGTAAFGAGAGAGAAAAGAAGFGASFGGSAAGLGASGAAAAGDIIIVPLKRAALARGSNSLPQAKHLLA